MEAMRCANPSYACTRLSQPMAMNLPANCKIMSLNLWRHYEAGDLKQAESISYLLLTLASKTEDVAQRQAHVLSAQCLHAMVLLAQDRTKEASELYQGIIRTATSMGELGSEQLLEASYGYLLTLYDLGDPRFDRACEPYMRTGAVGCKCLHTVHQKLVLGLYHLRRREFNQALSAFEVVEALGVTGSYYLIAAGLGITEVCVRRCELGVALSKLRALDIHLSRNTGTGALVTWRRRFSRAIATARQHGFGWVPDSSDIQSQPAIQTQPPRGTIEIRALGSGQLRVFGELREWHQRPLNKVLLTHLALHPNGVDRKSILADLWPEKRGDGDSVLHTALHHLRDLVGDQLVIFRNGLYSLPQNTWLDAIEHEQLYLRVRQLPLESRMGILQTAIGLYNGPFLQGVTGQWVEETRLRVANMQAWLLWNIAAIYGYEERYTDALYLLNQALEVNPLFDPAATEKVRLLDLLGERSEAMAFYGLYSSRIRKVLGVEPSPALTRLVQRFADEPDRELTQPFGRDALLRAAKRTIRITSH